MTEAVAPRDTPLRVAMMVGNDLTADTRVRKMAVGLSNAGAKVTLIGLSTTNARTEATIGDVDIVRLPVSMALRNAARQRKMWRPHFSLGYTSKEEYVVAARRRKLREREIAAEVGRINVQLAQLGEASADEPATRALRVALQARRRVLRLSIKPRRKYQQVRESLYRRKAAGEPGPFDGIRERSRELWARAPVVGDWRRLIPVIDDYELAYGPFLDELDPDVIHAHDVHMIGIAERAVARARNRGRHIRWVYDAHEYIPGLPQPDLRVLRGYIDLEREYIGRADRVITVSDPIADLLQQHHGLPRRPTVVLNIPVIRRPEVDGSGPSVRDAAAVPPDVPLLVYSGGVSAARGLDTIVDALPRMPGVHAAFVVRASSRVVKQLERRAAQLGARDRLHVVPFVEPDEVVTYLSSADVGVHTLLGGYMNHELALPNKYFEYMHARLPIVGTDLQAMGPLTRELGIGEPFKSGDPADFARATLQVLSDEDRYTKPYTERPEILQTYTWTRQERAMVEMYEELTGGPLADVGVSGPPRETTLLAEQSQSKAAAEASVLLGPANMAGQGWEWARAVQRQWPHVHFEVMTLEKKSPLAFPADTRVPRKSWSSLEWQLAQVRSVLTNHTHVLMEGGYGVFGTLTGDSFLTDAMLLEQAQIKYGVIFHGSEVRNPALHRKLEPASPYADDDSELSVRLQEVADQNSQRLDQFAGARFVTTLDLIDFVPEARWLPVVANPEHWLPGEEPLHRDRPVVVHIPSNAVLKGSAPVDVIAEEMDGLGLIEYRRLANVPVGDMPSVLADADIILDQFALGDYGVLAAQGMMTGRVVIGHVADRVRERLPEQLPIVEATHETFRGVLTEVLEDRKRFRDVARSGATFARTYHSGTYSAQQLRGFLGLEDSE